MSHAQAISATVTQSGQVVTIPNSAIQNSASLSVTFTPSVAGQSFITAVESSLDGEVTLLDTATVSGTTTRTIALTFAPDYFRLFAIWTNAPQSFSVSVAASASGTGATFAANLDLANVHTQ